MPFLGVQTRMTFSSDESMLHRCDCSGIWKTSLHLTYIPAKTSVSWIWSCCVAKHHGRADPWWIPDLDSLFPVVNLYQTGPVFRNWDDIKKGHYINSYFAALAASRHQCLYACIFGRTPSVTPSFKNKTRYRLYVCPGSQITCIETNYNSIKRQCFIT